MKANGEHDSHEVSKSGIEIPDLIEMQMPASSAISIYEVLDRHRFAPIIDGGWAVDAALGVESRPHQDIDFLIDIRKGKELRSLFESMGYISHPEETEMPHRLVVIKPIDKLMIDFHLVTFSIDGSAVFMITNYKEGVPSYAYEYSREGLLGVGTIGDHNVRCITLEEQVRCRTTRQYSADDTDRMRPGGINADRHDLELIRNLSSIALGTSVEES